MHTLESLGFAAAWQQRFAALTGANPDVKLVAGRVVLSERGLVQVLGVSPEPVWAVLRGTLRQSMTESASRPCVGDWVAVRAEANAWLLEHILPRSSSFSRRKVGRQSTQQLICANVDRVFIVTAVDQDFSPRRLERYVASVWSGGAEPVVVINKTDLPFDKQDMQKQLEQAVPKVAVAWVRGIASDGTQELEAFLQPGKTVAFVGSSGVGKSTLVNRVLGETRQEVGEIRDIDHKGRHTTTRRELVVAPSGALLIDTPGMREFGLWDAGEGLEHTFAQVQALASQCRFANCTHGQEPGCAVQAALGAGHLALEHWRNYEQLKSELADEARRSDKPVAKHVKKPAQKIRQGQRQKRKADRQSDYDDE